MGFSIKQVIWSVITLFIIGALLGLGLVSVSVIGDMQYSINGTLYLVSDVVDPTVLTLLTTLLPILVVVGIAVAYIPKM